MFIHGAADSGAVWDLQQAHFAGRHRVLAVDLPGHGGRLLETALDSHQLNAVEVARLAHDRGLANLVVVGHSMGGAIALHLALDEPARVRALLLVGSGARLRMPSHLVEEARQRAETARPGALAPRIIPVEDVLSPSAPGEVRAWLQQRFGQSTAQAVYADFVATHRFDLMDRVGEVQQPTLVIGGEDDRWTPPRFQHYLADHIPSARLVVLEATGHYPFVEEAVRFNEELEQLLAALQR